MNSEPTGEHSETVDADVWAISTDLADERRDELPEPAPTTTTTAPARAWLRPLPRPTRGAWRPTVRYCAVCGVVLRDRMLSVRGDAAWEQEQGYVPQARVCSSACFADYCRAHVGTGGSVGEAIRAGRTVPHHDEIGAGWWADLGFQQNGYGTWYRPVAGATLLGYAYDATEGEGADAREYHLFACAYHERASDWHGEGCHPVTAADTWTQPYECDRMGCELSYYRQPLLPWEPRVNEGR